MQPIPPDRPAWTGYLLSVLLLLCINACSPPPNTHVLSPAPDPRSTREQDLSELSEAIESADPHRIVSAARPIVETNPGHTEAWNAYVNALIALPDAHAADLILKAWRAAQPNCIEQIRAEASLALLNKDWKSARDIITRTLPTLPPDDPQKIPLLRTLLDVQIDSGETAAAEHTVSTLIAVSPEPVLHWRRALLRIEQGRWAEIAEDWPAIESATNELIPQQSRLHIAKIIEARAHFERLDAEVTAHPEALDPLVERARVFNDFQIASPALRDAQAAMKIAPEDIPPRREFLRALLLLNRSQDALAFAQSATQDATTQDWWLLRELGALHLQASQLYEAVHALSRSLDLHRDGRTLELRALALRALQRTEEADADLKASYAVTEGILVPLHSEPTLQQLEENPDPVPGEGVLSQPLSEPSQE